MGAHVNIKVDTEDLLALIGDDPEVRLTIQSSIVQQFAERHLKAVARDEGFKDLEKVLKEAVKAEVGEQVGTISYPNKVNLNDRMQASIRGEVASQIRSLVDSVTAEASKSIVNSVSPLIDSKVNARLDYDIKAAVDAEVKRRLTDAANA